MQLFGVGLDVYQVQERSTTSPFCVPPDSEAARGAIALGNTSPDQAHLVSVGVTHCSVPSSCTARSNLMIYVPQMSYWSELCNRLSFLPRPTRAAWRGSGATVPTQLLPPIVVCGLARWVTWAAWMGSTATLRASCGLFVIVVVIIVIVIVIVIVWGPVMCFFFC
jgi:hypothetical protein